VVSTIKASIISFFVTVTVAFGFLYYAELQENETSIVIPVQEVKASTKAIISQNEILCLKQNIHYEADGEPFRGKIAVGMVTLNRTKLSNKSICQVVFEPWQFSWTINKKNLTNKFSDDTIFAANLTLSGYNLIEELNNATYFHEAYTYPAWASEKRQITTIGNHIFYSEK